MNLPPTEYYPDDPDHLPPARRRRARRLLAPLEADERAAFLDELAHRISPTVNFFIFSFICALLLGIGLLMDAPSLLILGALVSPMMTPAIGISFGTVIGSGRFFVRSFIGLLIGTVLVFLAGTLLGLVYLEWSPAPLNLIRHFSQLSWTNFIVLAVGMVLTAMGMVNSDRKPLVPSVAVAFELYTPLVIAGFGLTSGQPNLWPDGLVIFAVYLAWAALLGAFTLAVLGFRPLTLFGYTLSGAVALLGIILLIGISGAGAAFGGQMALPTRTPIPPTITATLTPVPPTATATLTPVPPTETPTITPWPTQTVTLTPTLSPTPTPVYAYINTNGSAIRQDASYSGRLVIRIDKGQLVQVLETVQVGNTLWAHILVPELGLDGWIAQYLITVTTPIPEW